MQGSHSFMVQVWKSVGKLTQQGATPQYVILSTVHNHFNT